MPPNRFESEVESFLEGSHGDRTHIKRADHHTVTPLCGTLLFSEYIGSYNCGPALCELDEKAQQRIIDAGQLVLRARERHPQRSLAEHYNPLSMDPILLKAHNNLDREVDKAFDVARKLTNERQRQELLFASYGELARGYVSSLSSKSKPPAGSFPVRVILIGPAAGCRTLSLATPGTMTVPDENTSLP